MAIASSKITAQGQISIPAEVRRRLGVGAGAVVEWVESGEDIVVRRAGRFSSEDIHRVLFATGVPAARTVEEFDSAIKRHLARKHARR
jgi:AbrB family looped-hinge helix DNA binding protein